MLTLYGALWLFAFAASTFVLLRVPLTPDRRSGLVVGPLVMAVFAAWWISDVGFRWNLVTVMTLAAAYAVPVVALRSATHKPDQTADTVAPEPVQPSLLSRALTRDILPATKLLDRRVTWTVIAIALLSFASAGRTMVVAFEAPVFVWWLLATIIVWSETGDRRGSELFGILLIVFVVAWWPLLKPARVPLDPGFTALRVVSLVAAPLVARWFMRHQLSPKQADDARAGSGV